MLRFKRLALASSLGLLAMFSTALADQWNKKTILTVSEPIAVPGKTLTPGKYVMKLIDSPSNRHIVQVWNEDESQLITTVLALPNYRLRPTGDTKFTFWETASGQPKPIRSWFYPGDNFGQEFAYPKDMATQIAQTSNAPVPTTDSQDLTAGAVTQTDQTGRQTELDRETYTPPQQTAQAEPAPTQTQPQQEVAQATPPQATPQPEPAPVQTPVARSTPAEATPQTMPATGSPVPLLGLVSMASLGAAFVLRKRS